jgi:hypothetical protein
LLGGVVKGERALENLAKALLSESLQKEARGTEESQRSNNPTIGPELCCQSLNWSLIFTGLIFFALLFHHSNEDDLPYLPRVHTPQGLTSQPLNFYVSQTLLQVPVYRSLLFVFI